MKLCVDYYINRHFIHSTNEELPLTFRYDMQLILPEIHGKILVDNYGYNADGYQDQDQVLKDGIHIYPSDYFDSPRYNTMKNVVCIHRAQGDGDLTPMLVSLIIHQQMLQRRICIIIFFSYMIS